MFRAHSGPPPPMPQVLLKGFYVAPNAGAEVNQFTAYLHVLGDGTKEVAIQVEGHKHNLMISEKYYNAFFRHVDSGRRVLELEDGELEVEGTWWTTREGAQAQAQAQAQAGGRRRKSIHKKCKSHKRSGKSSHKKKSHRRRRH